MDHTASALRSGRGRDRPCARDRPRDHRRGRAHGDLDRQAADDILHLLETLNREFQKTILIVTHDPVAAERASITRRLDKGKLQ